ncbi:MAG: PKD domain-containing protein, partial [Propionibacteriaceae bacterium]|nr:PKD domain-containing protein [Propionibacteriaceae bacterium]
MYTVQLIATNACGNDTSTQEITIVTAPTAAFDLDAATGCAPFTVQAGDLSSSNTTGWAWSAPGATPEASTQQNPSFTFAAPGTYTITLEASNAAGTSAESIAVNVGGLPEAAFAAANTLGETTLSLSNNSLDAISYAWDFGDGSSSSEPEPAHSYAQDGVYTVQLIATNACGNDTST